MFFDFFGAMMMLSASVERFSVSRMRDFWVIIGISMKNGAENKIPKNKNFLMVIV